MLPYWAGKIKSEFEILRGLSTRIRAIGIMQLVSHERRNKRDTTRILPRMSSAVLTIIGHPVSVDARIQDR